MIYCNIVLSKLMEQVDFTTKLKTKEVIQILDWIVFVKGNLFTTGDARYFNILVLIKTGFSKSKCY